MSPRNGSHLCAPRKQPEPQLFLGIFFLPVHPNMVLALTGSCALAASNELSDPGADVSPEAPSARFFPAFSYPTPGHPGLRKPFYTSSPQSKEKKEKRDQKHLRFQ